MNNIISDGNWQQTDKFRIEKQNQRSNTLVETDGKKIQDYRVKLPKGPKTIQMILEEVYQSQKD